MQDASPKSKSHLKLVRNLITLFIILWLVGAHWYIDIHLYSRASYQQVIDEGRTLTAQTSEAVHFTGDWLFDPSASADATNICARKVHGNFLLVRILTYDAHEAGKLGYIYSDASFESDDELEETIEGAGCGVWNVSKRLLGGWWVIEAA